MPLQTKPINQEVELIQCPICEKKGPGKKGVYLCSDCGNYFVAY